MTDPLPRTVTRLLGEWRQGDSQAFDRLMPLIYDELRRIARRLMRSERREHTLEATALVHEAYARLRSSEHSVSDRVHFLSLAARVMRRVLVDHARARARLKRGQGEVRITLTESGIAASGLAHRIIEIDEALDRLESLDLRKVRVLEMRIFGGMTHAEIAGVLSVSVPTVERDFRMARAWLRAELEAAPDLRPH